MFYNLLVAIFCRRMLANIPFCGKQLTNLLQGRILIGNGQFGNESTYLCVEKSYISSSIHPLVALSNARFARFDRRWKCTTEYEAKIIIISAIIISTASNAKQCDCTDTAANQRIRLSSSFVIASIPSWLHDRFPIATAATFTTITSPRADGNHCHCSECEMCFW